MTPAQFKARREALGYTQAKLAKAMRIGLRTLGTIESGKRTVPKVYELALIGLAETDKRTTRT